MRSVTACDDNSIPFMFEPAQIEFTGPARIIGPALIPRRGGATGFRLESPDAAGIVTAMVTGSRLGVPISEPVAE